MEPIGGLWLAREYGIDPVQPLRYQSHIGPSRSIRTENGRWKNQYPAQYRPSPTLAGHLEFMIRHEAIHLEFLFRLFTKVGKSELEQWITEEPTGKYARRACFFYEELTEARLDFSGVTNLGYVEALDPARYFTSTITRNIPRWRVRNNMPGTGWASPTVMLSDDVKKVMEYDIPSNWAAVEKEFGEELLMRSAVWLTTKESRASFAIEHEQDQSNRIERFAQVISEFTALNNNPLQKDSLETLQRAILGEKATRYGDRESPVFVGEQRISGPTVHYIGPEPKYVPALLECLSDTDELTSGQNSIIRAAILSFLFVYIHPMSDGNGRISRFLINDVLRRDGLIRAPFILPVSSAITNPLAEYDRILDVFSKRFMDRYAGRYQFESVEKTYPDGVVSNFVFDGYDDAIIALRYIDLTDHVVYLGDIVKRTLEIELVEEAKVIRKFGEARRALNEVIEGSSQDLDRIIRSIQQNNGEISGKLKSEFPMLEDSSLAAAAAEAVVDAFK